MNGDTHIINRVFLEVQTDSTKKAYDLKDNLDMFLKESLFPHIENYFNEVMLSFPNQFLQLEQLTLDVKVSDDDDLSTVKRAIDEQLRKEIKKHINQEQYMSFNFSAEKGVIANEDSVFVNARGKRNQAFLHFLQTGKLPWYQAASSLNAEEFQLETLLKKPDFVSKLSQVLGQKEALTRLILQHDHKQLTQVLSAILKTKVKKEISAPKVLVSDKNLKQTFWTLVFRVSDKATVMRMHDTLLKKVNAHFGEENLKKLMSVDPQALVTSYYLYRIFDNTKLSAAGKKELKTFVQGVLNVSLLDDQQLSEIASAIKKEKQREALSHEETSTEKIEGKTSTTQEKIALNDIKEELTAEMENVPVENEDLAQGIIVNNAGAILLHPFLKQLFDTLKVLDDKGNIKESQRSLAVHLLHYATTKEEQEYESSMLFEKFLCGIDLDFPIEKNIVLTKEQKKEIEDLLEALIGNWPKLKNTSPDGLREGFLKRDGKLIVEDDKYRLIIERKAQDILLEKLPWNINLIRLPWLEKLLFVEW